MAPMATDLSTLTPVEIDTFLSENYDARFKLHFQIRREESLIERLAARGHSTTSAEAELKELHVQYADLVEASFPYYSEYDRRPWNRYFLVKNGNGHVHRGTDCTTCFATTQYGWLVELADCDESAMVEEWGERACTVCFPDAPTNPLYHRPARIDREARDAKDAEKAAKAAAKAEKAITDVDGSELRLGGRYGDVLRTKVAARNKLSELIQNTVWYSSHTEGEGTENIFKLARALQAAGIDWVAVVDRAFKKAVKEATAPYSNPYGLTEAQIAETRAQTARNIEAATALIARLKEEVVPV